MKRIHYYIGILGLLVLLSFSPSQGQPLYYVNVLCGFMKPLHLVTDVNGNVYACGMLTVPIDFNPTAASNIVAPPVGGGNSMYVAKYNSAGTYLWSFPIHIGDFNSDDAYPNSMKVDSLGNIYITGIFDRNGVDMDPGPGTYPINTMATMDIASFLAKYNTNGQFVCAVSFSDQNTITDVAIANDQSIYVVGVTDGTDVDPGPNIVTVPVQQFDDRFLMKLDSMANFLWIKVFNSNGQVNDQRIHLDNMSNIIICGSYSNTLDFDPGPGTYFQFWLTLYFAQYDSSGNFLWAKGAVEYSGTCNQKQFAIDASNNLYLAGYIASPNVDFNADTNAVYYLSSNGLEDPFLAKYDPNGNLTWAKSFGGSDNDIAYDLGIDPYGNCYISGIFRSDTVDFNPGTGTFNLSVQGTGKESNFLSVLDSSGQFIKAFAINGSDIGYPNIAQNAVGNSSEFWVGGHMTLPVDFDPGPSVFGAGGCNDGGFIAKYGTQFLGLNDLNAKINPIVIYPNPAISYTNIEVPLTKNTDVQFSVSDIQGRLIANIYNNNVGAGIFKHKLDLGELKQGIYIIMVQTSEGIFSEKLIKM